MSDCVCWAPVKGCVAISRHVLLDGHTCANCPFYKTQYQYIAETGMTYEDAMRKVKKYIEAMKGTCK